MPWVQLKGYWLEAVGFNIDTRIQVRVMKGCLVLTVITEPQEE
ncbi:MAG: type I addiction module toxin, SymE family [Gammaproteobacteria bacterium]|nr:type I addiction module toxin, SymE family [Gammaproteobacteria bacterium]